MDLYTRNDCKSDRSHLCEQKTLYYIVVREKRGADVGRIITCSQQRYDYFSQGGKRKYTPIHKLDLLKLNNKNIKQNFTEKEKDRQKEINYGRSIEDKERECWAEYFKVLLNVQSEEIIMTPEEENKIEPLTNNKSQGRSDHWRAIES